MSSAVTGSTYSNLDRLLSASGSLQDQISTLQEQTTTGDVSQSYAGLASVSARVLALKSASSQAGAYTQSITSAQGKASAMQSALTQIQSLASTMSQAALGLTGTSSSTSVDSVATQAQLALKQLGSLLNTNYAGDYVFSGADTANPPVPLPDSITSSGLYTHIGAEVSALATTPTSPAVAQVIANTVSIASSTAAGTTVFSSYLTGAGASAAATKVQISDSQTVSLDLPANQNVGVPASSGGTGSAIGDLMRSLAVLANGTGSMAGNPDFATLMQDAATTLSSAGNTIAQESGQIGLTQDAMTAATNAHAATKALLTTQLTGLTEVNMADAISHLQAVTSQLEASYKVLSAASSLNLASYLNF